MGSDLKTTREMSSVHCMLGDCNAPDCAFRIQKLEKFNVYRIVHMTYITTITPHPS